MHISGGRWQLSQEMNNLAGRRLKRIQSIGHSVGQQIGIYPPQDQSKASQRGILLRSLYYMCFDTSQVCSRLARASRERRREVKGREERSRDRGGNDFELNRGVVARVSTCNCFKTPQKAWRLLAGVINHFTEVTMWQSGQRWQNVWPHSDQLRSNKGPFREWQITLDGSEKV